MNSWSGEFEFPFAVGMVGEVAQAPEGLGEAEDEAEVEGENSVEPPRGKEGTVDEVVGDGVGAPPQGDRDQQRRWVEEKRCACKNARLIRTVSHLERRRGEDCLAGLACETDLASRSMEMVLMGIPALMELEQRAKNQAAITWR